MRMFGKLLLKQNNTRGSALITALFIVTIVAITATAMSVRLQMDIYRTQLSSDHQSDYLKAQAFDSYSVALLKRDDLPKLPYAFNAKTIGLTDISGTATLEDAQAKYNLNNLATADAIPSFIQLLIVLDPSLSEHSALAIAEQLHHRIAQQHLPFVLPQEVLEIKVIPTPLASKLIQHVTALPSETPLNINTASATVLRTLGAGLTAQQAQLLIDARKQLNQDSVLDQLKIPEKQITVLSDYYLSTISIENDPGQKSLQLLSLYKRNRIEEHPIIVHKIYHVIR